MTRNRYSIEFENEMKQVASSYTFNELLTIAQKKYKYNITKDMLMKYLSKRKIRYSDYNKKKVRVPANSLPIGSEYVKDDGMTLIKIAQDKWMYKQRYIYEQYYKVKLNTNEYVIFLDGDRTNFNIKNLYKITNREASILGNMRLASRNKEITKLTLTLAKSIIAIKNLERRVLTNHKKNRR